jgi:hypothetical protein
MRALPRKGTPVCAPLDDDRVWDAAELAAVKEPECPRATAAGGCPPDCNFCERYPVPQVLRDPLRRDDAKCN